jgi:hypothetical protein
MSRFRIGKRQSVRTKSVLPVRIWIAGSKDIHLAHTFDVSNHGVRLGSYVGGLKIGDEIVIQYHQTHAQFRVTWIIACESSSEKQIGSLLARAHPRSKSGLSAWSRESNSGVRHSLSKWMSTKNKIDREEAGMLGAVLFATSAQPAGAKSAKN